jgi:hypothetical protein
MLERLRHEIFRELGQEFFRGFTAGTFVGVYARKFFGGLRQNLFLEGYARKFSGFTELGSWKRPTFAVTVQLIVGIAGRE